MFKTYDKEKNTLIWRLWIILLIEFMGTFILVFGIIAPATFGWNHLTENSSQIDEIMYNIFFASFIQTALYVSTLILSLIFMLAKISVNINPAVTLAEVAVGNTKWHVAGPMIVIQLAGAILASVVAYDLINVIGTQEVVDNLAGGQFTLDSVSPWLHAPKLFAQDMSTITAWNEVGPQGNEWIYALPVYLLEFLFTFALMASVVYGKKITHNQRPFVIYITLIVIITLGCMTSNVALNPARLLGPAIVGHLVGTGTAANTMQYQMIYLAGELSAVALIFFIESQAKENSIVSNVPVSTTHKVVIGSISVSEEVSELSLLPLGKKVKNTWTKNGNRDLSIMDKQELIETANELGVSINKKDIRSDIEDDIIAFLIFGI